MIIFVLNIIAKRYAKQPLTCIRTNEAPRIYKWLEPIYLLVSMALNKRKDMYISHIYPFGDFITTAGETDLGNPHLSPLTQMTAVFMMAGGITTNTGE